MNNVSIGYGQKQGDTFYDLRSDIHKSKTYSVYLYLKNG